MNHRKSRPRFQDAATQLRVIEVGDNTTVDNKPALSRQRMGPVPTGSRSGVPQPAPLSVAATPMSAPNVIPFAKPRAIAAHPATFGPKSSTITAIREPLPTPVGTWGSAAVAAAQPAPISPVVAPPARMPKATPAPAMQAPAPKPIMNAPTAVASPAVTQEAPKTAAAPSRWAAFEHLGLHAPKVDAKKWTKHVVGAYRLLGFIILTIIVIVLVGYLATTAFFYMSNSWIVPMAISPTDEKVVSLQSQLSERQTNRDRTAAELDNAERAIKVQQEFQAEFAKAIKSDLDGRKAALARMYELANQAASTRAQIKRSNSAYASAEQRRMAAEWKAGLIDRNGMLNGKFQIAQISGSNLSLAERQAEYETRAADLDSQTRSLEALLANTGSGEGALSYDVLKIKQEYEASRLETQRAIQNRDMLKTALEREDKLVSSLKQSSYLKALADQASVAFVPYGNLTHIKAGEPIYGCYMTMVFCKRVGTVLEVLPGEVQFKHPNRDKQLRGQMVELKLEDAAAATDDVLFVGGRPLLI
jgi:hypothetical protein